MDSGLVIMIEPINYWTTIIVYLTLLIKSFSELLKAINRLENEMNHLPKQLKTIFKILVYILTIIVPNIGIIWYFFYLTGLSPNRINEANFFWAMVAQPTIGVSIYAYIWGSWFYPKLRVAFSEKKLKNTQSKREKVSSIKDGRTKTIQSGRKK